MFRVATMTTAWRVRLAAMSAALRQSARSQFLKLIFDSFDPSGGAQIVDMIDSGVAFSRKRGAT